MATWNLVNADDPALARTAIGITATYVSTFAAAGPTNQAAIQAAITEAAAKSDGVVDFEGVHYVTTGTVTVADNAVTLQNGGIVPTGEFCALHVTGDDVTVRDMTFDRAATSPYSASSPELSCVQVAGERFRSLDCHYLGAELACVYLIGGACDGSVIRGGSMTGTPSRQNACGVYAQPTATGNQNITVEGVTIHDTTDGVVLYDTGASRVANNRVTNLRKVPTIELTGWTLVSGNIWKQRTATGSNPGVDGPPGDRDDGSTIVLFDNGTQRTNVGTSTPGTNEWGSVDGWVYLNLGGTDPNTRTITSAVVSGYGLMVYVKSADPSVCSDNRIVDNYVEDCDGFGIYLQIGNGVGARNNHVAGNILKDVCLEGAQTLSLPFSGIGVTGGADTLISDNTIDGVGASGKPAPGVQVFGNPSNTTPSGRIVGTTVKNGWGPGFHLWASNWQLVGCRAADNQQAGFLVSHSTAAAIVRGVVLAGCVSERNATDGFSVNGLTSTIGYLSASIIGGAAIGNTYRGIDIRGSANATPTLRDVTVQGVTLKDNGSASYAQVNIVGIAARIIVTGCTMSSATASAVGLQVGANCTDVTVENNSYDIAIPESLTAPVRAGGSLTAQWRGAGSPEGVVTAPIGSIYQRSDSVSEAGLYVKEIGSGNTGWLGARGFACKTATGSTGAENGANTWAKIATLTAGAAYIDTAILLACTASTYAGTPDTAIISAHLRANAASGNPTLQVQILGKPETTKQIGANSFKLIAPASTAGGVATAELWVQKKATYGTLTFFELSRSLYNTSCSVSYSNLPAWQSATPTNTVEATSAGVTAFGVPVGTKVAVPASASAAGVVGQWAADASYHYDCIATDTWVRSAAATW